MSEHPKYLAPTPWRVDMESKGQQWTDSISIADARGGHIAHLTRGYEAEPMGEDGNLEGCPSYTNAHLIAAAPDLLQAAVMLEAAEQSRDGCPECEGEGEPEACGKCFPAFDDARIARRLAIAKAEGVSQKSRMGEEQ